MSTELTYDERRVLHKALSFDFDLTLDDIAYSGLSEDEIESQAEHLRVLKNLMVKFTVDLAVKP